MKTLVLDRDGVINFDSPDYIKSPDEWRPIPGSIEAIARAARAGFRIAVASNQSGLARELFDLDTLSAIHAKLIEAVENARGHVDLIVFCPHHPDEGCACRKPKVGLLRRIENELGVDLRGQWFVGDSDKDLLAAREAGMVPVLVRTGNGADVEKTLDADNDVKVFDDLAAAVDTLLEQQ